MRTSNKILLGTFLVILFIITGIHVGLYAKYKGNNFITMTNLHNEQYNRYDLKGIRSVSLSGLQSVTIIPADTARLEIEKNGFFKVHYQFTDGVLTIKGDSMVTGNGNMPERVRSYEDVIIYLPSIQAVKADFCELSLNASRDSSKVSSWAFELNETSLHLGGRYHTDDAGEARFNAIRVTRSAKSSIDITGNLRLNELSLNLGDSNFEDGGLTADSLFINTDNSSSVKLSGKNIARTKFSLKP